MSRQEYAVGDVFDITGGIPLNYVERDYVDDKFQSILSRDKHVVIFGGSKQGKTCLRKRCLDDDDQIVIQCGNTWEISDIHETILKQVGFQVTTSEKETVSGTQKIKATVSAAIQGIGSSVSGESKTSESHEETTKPLELDPTNVNDIIRALEKIDLDKYIVLEDFHYLPEDTQKDFSIALKAFHEASSLKFIIVGVWLEENQLILFNGDLRGRVVSVNADRWENQDLHRVIENGESLLNVEFDDAFKQGLISNCYDSVSILQEACRKACEAENVSKTQNSRKIIGENIVANEIVNNAIKTRSARYRSFLREFSEGFQSTELEMYRWLLYPILSAEPDELQEGLIYGDIRETIESRHPVGKELNPGNLTQSLQSIGSLQSELEIKPFIWIMTRPKGASA